MEGVSPEPDQDFVLQVERLRVSMRDLRDLTSKLGPKWARKPHVPAASPRPVLVYGPAPRPEKLQPGICVGPVLLLLALLQGMPSLFKRLSFVTYRRRLHRLGVSKVTQVDFLPREVVSYSKETQTPLATHQSEGKLCLLFAFYIISRRNCQWVLSFLLILHLTIADLPRT